MNETTAEYFTTRQLARLWQVSEATIKRWADAGHLRFSRTLGGHRRFALAEVARFQSERALTSASSAEVEKTQPRAASFSEDEALFHKADAAEQFFEAAINGREAAAAAILFESYLSGISLVKILDVTITGAMHRVGKLWHGGEMSVADEHLATRTTMRALESLRAAIMRKERSSGGAVCCAAEAEFHELPVLCVQILLESEGWSVKNLGAHTPFFALADAIEKHRPRLVCVSSTTHGEIERSAREYQQFQTAVKACGARVVLGGEGFRDEEVRRRFPADLHAENFSQLLEFIQAGSQLK